MRYSSDRLLPIVDLAATLFLGVQGGIAGIDANLDVFGVVVLSCATALGGGVIRDLLIGTQPASVSDPRYTIAALTGGLMAILLNHSVREVPVGLMIGIDAAGLSLYAVAGAAKALDFRLSPLMAVLMGTITGVGGGIVRDIFLARIPSILRVEVYATAALIGAAVMIIGVWRGLSRNWMMAIGAVVCFVLRMYAAWHHWNLPKVTG